MTTTGKALQRIKALINEERARVSVITQHIWVVERNCGIHYCLAKGAVQDACECSILGNPNDAARFLAMAAQERLDLAADKRDMVRSHDDKADSYAFIKALEIASAFLR